MASAYPAFKQYCNGDRECSDSGFITFLYTEEVSGSGWGGAGNPVSPNCALLFFSSTPLHLNPWPYYEPRLSFISTLSFVLPLTNHPLSLRRTPTASPRTTLTAVPADFTATLETLGTKSKVPYQLIPQPMPQKVAHMRSMGVWGSPWLGAKEKGRGRSFTGCHLKRGPAGEGRPPSCPVKHSICSQNRVMIQGIHCAQWVSRFYRDGVLQQSNSSPPVSPCRPVHRFVFVEKVGVRY